MQLTIKRMDQSKHALVVDIFKQQNEDDKRKNKTRTR